MVPEFEKLLESGVLEIISVSLDTESTLPEMKNLIREHDIDFPVIYGSSAATDWGCRMVPSSYLVDPQGVIATSCRATTIEASLQQCQSPDHNPFTVHAVHSEVQDGKVVFTVQAGNLDHSPLSVSLNINPTVYETDSGALGGLITGRRPTNYLADFAVLQADELDAFGEATFRIEVPLDTEWDGLFYQILAMPPDPKTSPGHWSAASCMGTIEFSIFESVAEGRRLISKWSTPAQAPQAGQPQQ